MPAAISPLHVWQLRTSASLYSWRRPRCHDTIGSQILTIVNYDSYNLAVMWATYFSLLFLL